MKVKFSVGTTYVGSEVEDIIDLPDDLTDDDIEKEFQDWVWENIDTYWKKV